MADIDLEKKSSHSGEQHASAPRDQEKVVPSADYIENYKGKSGYSRNFAAIAEAKGFKPDDGRLVVDPEEAKIEYGEEVRPDALGWPEFRRAAASFVLQGWVWMG